MQSRIHQNKRNDNRSRFNKRKGSGGTRKGGVGMMREKGAEESIWEGDRNIGRE